MRKFKFSNINRRHLTLIGLVMVIAVAGYININYTEDAVETLAPVNTDAVVEKVDDYTSAVMERDSKRSESMQVYRDIVDNSNCDKQTKENAQAMLTSAAKFINDESKIESSLKAKGVEKSIVYIDENEVTAIVYDMKLDEIIVSQIKDVIENVSGFSAEKIKIIENK
ncbi:MAG: SpoIIIAH-like family protein [Clostridia bacterium]|nr:SpoIIIAH-like family protein [Clostridia bacterium]